MDIYFTPLAQERLDTIVEYLSITWGESVKSKFLSEFMRCLRLISINQILFPLFEEYEDVRRCLVTSYNTIYYRVKNSQIQILTIWDNRMDPLTLKFLISRAY